MILFVVAMILACFHQPIEKTRQLQSFDSIPDRLLSQHCPSGSEFHRIESNGMKLHYCIDSLGRLNGPELLWGKTQRRLAFYSHGSLRQTPHFTDSRGELDKATIKAYAKEISSTRLAEDLLAKDYPFIDAFLFRHHWIKKGIMGLSEQFDTDVTTESCRPSEWRCTQGRPILGILKEGSRIEEKYAVLPTLYHVERRATRQDVLDCLANCSCSNIEKISPILKWTDAVKVCQASGARLPTEMELLNHPGSPISNGGEWTIDPYLPIEDGRVSREVPIVVNGDLKTVLRRDGIRMGFTATNRLPFRCVSSFPIQQKEPIRELTNSEDTLSKILEKAESKSSGARVVKPNFEQIREDLKALSPIKDNSRLKTALSEIQSLYPDRLSMYSIGASHQKRPIYALKVSSFKGDNAPSLLLLGGMDGSDWMSSELVLNALIHVLEKYERIGLNVWFVPMLNVDRAAMMTINERRAVMGHKNVRNSGLSCATQSPKDGVNLFRNYPYLWRGDSNPLSTNHSGPYAGSEPETMSLMRLAEQIQFDGALVLRSGGNKMIVPFSSPFAEKVSPDFPWAFAHQLLKSAGKPARKKITAQHSRKAQGTGVLQDWLYYQFGTMAFQLDLPTRNPKKRSRKLKDLKMMRSVLDAFLRRYQKGSSIYGKILSTTGQPLAAQVRVVGDKSSVGMKWASRGADGFYHRFVNTGGAVTLKVEADGHYPVLKTVRLSDKPKEVSIVLRPL